MPLTFHLETAELPVAKHARETYEWLVPRGIFKRNWVGLLIKVEATFTLRELNCCKSAVVGHEVHIL